MDLINKIQALLFLSGDPIDIKELESFFNIDNEKIIEKLNTLKHQLKDSGLEIKIFDEKKVQMTTNAKYGETIHKFFYPDAKPKKLTKAALETITIIAYKQPITKSEIEAIRGVNVEKVLTTLEERDLIEICGKKNTIGTPNLYRVTESFFDYVGINNIEELPRYKEVKNGQHTVE